MGLPHLHLRLGVFWNHRVMMPRWFALHISPQRCLTWLSEKNQSAAVSKEVSLRQGDAAPSEPAAASASPSSRQQGPPPLRRPSAGPAAFSTMAGCSGQAEGPGAALAAGPSAPGGTLTAAGPAACRPSELLDPLEEAGSSGVLPEYPDPAFDNPEPLSPSPRGEQADHGSRRAVATSPPAVTLPSSKVCRCRGERFMTTASHYSFSRTPRSQIF